MKPEFATIDRPTPLEALVDRPVHTILYSLVTADTSETAISHLGYLVENLALPDSDWESTADLRRRILDALPDDVDTIPLFMACAQAGDPHISGVMSQSYAALAVDLAKWDAAHAWEAETPADRAVVGRVRERLKAARDMALGWAAVAAGRTSARIVGSAPPSAHAEDLAADIAAATAPREIVPESNLTDRSWMDELSGEYGWMSGGSLWFEHLGGWRYLMRDLLESIDRVLREEDREHFSISQIKEKYGSVRCYVHGGGSEIDRLIEIAERRSEISCDVCGDAGRVQGTGWYSCRCPRHEKWRG